MHGEALFHAIATPDFEVIVAKRVNAPYKTGRPRAPAGREIRATAFEHSALSEVAIFSTPAGVYQRTMKPRFEFSVGMACAQVTVSCEPFASARLPRTRKRGHHEGVSLACRVRMTLPSFDVHQNFDSVLMNRRCIGQTNGTESAVHGTA